MIVPMLTICNLHGRFHKIGGNENVLTSWSHLYQPNLTLQIPTKHHRPVDLLSLQIRICCTDSFFFFLLLWPYLFNCLHMADWFYFNTTWRLQRWLHNIYLHWFCDKYYNSGNCHATHHYYATWRITNLSDSACDTVTAGPAQACCQLSGTAYSEHHHSGSDDL